MRITYDETAIVPAHRFTTITFIKGEAGPTLLL